MNLFKLLEKIRISQCLKYCQGKILDIGCGHNALVKKYGNGVGVDVYPWEGVDVVCDTTNLPFKESEFDRVFLIASLNHIPRKNREKVLKEAFRVLKPNGMIVITMIGPKIGFWVHKFGSFFRWDTDQTERGMKSGEAYGMSQKAVKDLLTKTGFKEIYLKKFELGFNVIFLAKKP